ncbi:unnamed protein product, partial [Amoebophrya sp. A120]
SACQLLRDDGLGSPISILAYNGTCNDEVGLFGLEIDRNYRFQTVLTNEEHENRNASSSIVISYASAGTPIFPNAFKPRITKDGKSDVVLSWIAPNDMGSPVLGFVVAYTTGTHNDESKWTKIYDNPENPNQFTFRVTDLDSMALHRFRVHARNRVGLGLPSSENSIQLSRLQVAPLSRALQFPRTVPVTNSGFRTVLQGVDPRTNYDDKQGGRLFLMQIRNLCELDPSDKESCRDYWNNQWLQGLPFAARQEVVDFDWKDGIVGSAASVDFVAAKWSGYLVPQYTQRYTFSLQADDGVKLYVNNELIVDKWYETSGDFSGAVDLKGNTFVPIELVYREVLGNATCKLFYQSFSVAKQIVPGDRLYRGTWITGFPTFIQSAIDTSPSKSTVFGPVIETKTALAGETNEFFIQARDQLGFNRSTVLDHWEVLLTHSEDSNINIFPTVTPYPSADRETGMYRVTFTLETMGTYKMSLKIHGEFVQHFPMNIEGLAGRPDVESTQAFGNATSYFYAGVAADFEVFVKDKFGNAVTDANLQIEVAIHWEGYIAGSAYFDGKAVSDTDLLNAEFGRHFFGSPRYDRPGVYVVTYTALRAGNNKMYVKVRGQNVRGSPFAVIGYAQRDMTTMKEQPFGPRCKVTSGEPPTEWRAGSYHAMMVQLRDAFGNPLSTPLSQRPNIRIFTIPTSSREDNFECKPYLGCDADYHTFPTTWNIIGQFCTQVRGVYECTMRPEYASLGNDRYIDIQVLNNSISKVEAPPPLNNTEVTMLPVPIQISPGPVSAIRSEVLGLPRNFVAGVGIIALLQWRDEFGNNLVSSPTILDFQLKMSGESLPYTDNFNGTYTIVARSTSAGVNNELEAKVVGEHLKDSPISGLNVRPGPASASGSSCEIPKFFPVGVATRVGCSTNDEFNNPISELDLLIYAEAVSQTVGGQTVRATGAYDRITKRYQMPLTITEIGNFSMAVRLEARGGLMAQYYRAPQFQSMISKRTDLNHVGEMVTEYTQIDPFVSFVWPASPIAEGTPDFFSIRWSGMILPKFSGAHYFRIESDYRCAILLNGKAIVDKWNVDVPVAETATVPAGELLAGVHVPFEIWYEHRTGTAYIRVFWRTAAYAEEVIPAVNLIYPLNILSANIIAPSTPADASTRSLICEEIVDEAMVSVANVFYLHTLDSYGNPRYTASSVQIAGTVKTTPPTAITFNHVADTGYYTVEFTPTRAGTFDIEIKVGNGFLAAPIQQAVRVLIRPGQPSPIHSLVEGAGLAYAMAGVWSEFNVTLRDENENPTGVSAGQDVGSNLPDVACLDIGGYGKFRCRYNIQIAGKYEMKVLVNGINVLALQPGVYNLFVSSRVIDPSSGILYPFKHTQMYTEIKRATENVVVFNAADEYGNPVTSSETTELEIVCEAWGPRTLKSQLNEDVLYLKVAQIPDFAGMYRLIMQVNADRPLGQYTLDCFIVKRGGVNSAYYNDIWLEGNYSSTIVDTHFDFQWIGGRVTANSSDMVGAQFNAYLKAPSQGVYNFYLTVDDVCKIWLDGVITMDTYYPGVHYIPGIFLTQQKLYSVHAMYRDYKDFARLKLEWECAECGITREVVGQTNFYHSRLRLGNFPRYFQVFDCPGKPDAFYRDVPQLSGEVRLKWLPPLENGDKPVTGFRLYRNTGNGDAAKVLLYETADHLSTGYTDSGVDATKIYKYALVSRNLGCDSDPYEIEVQPTTAPGIPNPPEFFNTSSKFGQITLKLTPPLDNGGAQAWHYELQHNNGHDGPANGYRTIFGNVDADSFTQQELSTIYILKNLVRGRIYKMRVRYATIVSWSPWSAEISILCCELIKPEVRVTGLRRSKVLPNTATQLSIEWDVIEESLSAPIGSSNIIGYKVWMLTSTKTIFGPVASPTIGYNEVESEFDTPSVDSYAFQVAACNVAGCGPRSERIALQAVDVLERPSFNVNTNKTWPAGTDMTQAAIPTPTASLLAKGYRIFCDDGLGGPITNVVHYNAPPTMTRIVFTGYYKILNSNDYEVLPLEVEKVTFSEFIPIVRGRKYRFHVAAINAAGESLTTEIPLQVTAATKPHRMEPPFAVPELTDFDKIVLSWFVPDDGGDPITEFEIEKKIVLLAKVPNTVDYLLSNANLTFTDSAVNASEQYEYRIKAINDIKTGTETLFSYPAQLVAAPVPSTPLLCGVRKETDEFCHFAVSASTRNSISLKFSPPTSAAEVTKFTIFANNEKVFESDAGHRNFTFTNCEFAQIYEFELVVTSFAGASARSRKLKKTCTAPPGKPANARLYSASKEIVTLEWDAPENDGGGPITGYTVERSMPFRGETDLQKSDLNYFTCADDKIAKDCPDNTCWYRVRASNGVDESNTGEPSNYVVLVAADPPHPPPLRTIRRIDNVRSPTEIEIAWDPIVGSVMNGGDTVIGYNVYCNDGSSESAVPYLDAELPDSTIRSYKFQNRIPGRMYSIQIAARNRAGVGKRSEVAKFFAGVPPAKMERPLVVHTTRHDGLNTTTKLKERIDLCNPAVLSYNVTGLTPGLEYKFAVTAHGRC